MPEATASGVPGPRPACDEQTEPVPTPINTAEPGRFDVIVLTGGTSQRFGADKLGARFGRGTLLEHAVAGCRGAGSVVLAGPPRRLAGWARPPGARLTWRGEEPPGQGPVAGLAAALADTTAEVLVVLGGDMPLAGRLLPPMLAALGSEGSDGADGVVVAVDGTPGEDRARPPLLWVLRRAVLLTQLNGLGSPAGAALHRVLDGLRLATVPDPNGWSADIDTETDLVAARARLTAAGTSPD